MIFVTTGNSQTKANTGCGESIVALNATTLKVLHSWQVPVNQTKVDSDFGGSPVLFTSKGGAAMVAAINKNGWIYVWYQSNLTLAWERHLSSAVTISTPSWSGTDLYVTSESAWIGATHHPSTVRKPNPETGTLSWQRGLNYPHSGYVSPLWVSGAVVVPANNTLTVLDALNGKLLYSHGLNGSVLAPAAISRGELFVGTTEGYLYSFGLPSESSVEQSSSEGATPRQTANSVSQGPGHPSAASALDSGSCPRSRNKREIPS